MTGVVDVAGRRPMRRGQWTAGPDGRVVVTRRKFGPIGTRFARLLRLSPDVRITLDLLGTAAWNRMDGRTTSAILAELETEFPDEGRLDERLGHYLAQLAQAGLLSFD